MRPLIHHPSARRTGLITTLAALMMCASAVMTPAHAAPSSAGAAPQTTRAASESLPTLEAGDLTTTSVKLSWADQPKRGFVVRRAKGNEAPATPWDGDAVTVASRATTVTDTGLTPGTTYSYSLFSHRCSPTGWGWLDWLLGWWGPGRPPTPSGPGACKPRGGWSDPVSVTVGLPSDTSPAYALAPGATWIPKSGNDTVTVAATGPVTLKPDPSRPTPRVGDGVYVAPRPGLPAGYVAKVASIAADGTLTLAQGALSDIYTSFSLNWDATDIASMANASSGVSPRRAARLARAAALPTGTTSFAGDPTFSCPNGGFASLTNASTTMDWTGSHVRIDLAKGVNAIDVVVAPTILVSGDLAMVGSGGCRATYQTQYFGGGVAMSLAPRFEVTGPNNRFTISGLRMGSREGSSFATTVGPSATPMIAQSPIHGSETATWDGINIDGATFTATPWKAGNGFFEQQTQVRVGVGARLPGAGAIAGLELGLTPYSSIVTATTSLPLGTCTQFTSHAGTNVTFRADAFIGGSTFTFTTPPGSSSSAWATSPIAKPAGCNPDTWGSTPASGKPINLTSSMSLVSTYPKLPGAPVTYDVVVTNEGPADAIPGWSITALFQPGLEYRTFLSSDVQCTATVAQSSVTCVSSRRLPAGMSTRVTLAAQIHPAFDGPTVRAVAYVAPAPNDAVEVNPLVIPTLDTDTASSSTDNDSQAQIAIDPWISVGDYVWWDNNGNGIQDPGEEPASGVRVVLLSPEGIPIVDRWDSNPSAVTDAQGFYAFQDLVPSTTYQLEFQKPSGSVFTTRKAGADDNRDSDVDASTGRVIFTTPATGRNGAAQVDLPILDAGLRRVAPSTLSPGQTP